MKKYYVLLMTAMMLSLAACAGNAETVSENSDSEIVEVSETVSDEDTEEVEAEETEETVEEAIDYTIQYPITITDQAGREVTIESEPQKIVSGYYISSSMLIALGIEDKLVGIEAKADKRPIYKLSAEELIDLPSVGSAKEFDLEGCIALEPDLVILPMKLKDAAATMEELGIPVVLVNPENQDLLLEMADIIATATNTVEKEEELVAYIDEQMSLLSETRDEVAGAGIETASVYLAGNSDFLSTAGNGMYQTDLIALAGGYNVASEIEDSYWVDISYEQVLAWDPEYIILTSDADYTVEDVLNNENLVSCKAVVNGNVYQMPSKAEAWDSPVPSGVLGAVWLANTLYPDYVSDDEYNDIVEEYYETFYGFSYNEN